jgi:hypothetical protein
LSIFKLFNFLSSKSSNSDGPTFSESSHVNENVDGQQQDFDLKDSKSVLDDNLLSEECMLITKSGATIFKTYSVDELLYKNRLLISDLQDNLLLFYEDFDAHVIPLIRTVARICSVAPASQALHDCENGGLFRHTLFVAVNALRILETSHSFDKLYLNYDEMKLLRLSVVVIAFLHDLGKLKTDVRFSTLGDKYTFDFSHEHYLDDFVQKHQANALKVRFIRRRAKRHNKTYYSSFKLLLKDHEWLITNLAHYPKLKTLWYDFLSGNDKSLFLKHLIVSDIYACKSSIKRYNSLYEIGNYLKSLFYSKTLDFRMPGFYKLKEGYLIAHLSDAYKDILYHFDSYYALLDKVESFDAKSVTYDARDAFSILSNLKKNQGKPRNNQENHGQEDDDPLFSAVNFDEHYGYLKNSIALKEAFYKVLTNTNFLMVGAYKMSCAYRAVKKGNVVSIVYGFVIKLDDNCEISLDDLNLDVGNHQIGSEQIGNEQIGSEQIGNNQKEDFYNLIGEYRDADLKKVVDFLKDHFLGSVDTEQDTEQDTAQGTEQDKVQDPTQGIEQDKVQDTEIGVDTESKGKSGKKTTGVKTAGKKLTDKKLTDKKLKEGYRVVSFDLKENVLKEEFNAVLDDVEKAVALINLDTVVLSDFKLERLQESKDRLKEHRSIESERKRSLKQQIKDEELRLKEFAKSQENDDIDFF